MMEGIEAGRDSGVWIVGWWTRARGDISWLRNAGARIHCLGRRSG